MFDSPAVADRPSRALRFLSWFSASLAIAIASHAAIECLASESGGHAYGRYAHAAFVPILAVAVALGSALVLWSAMRRFGGIRGIDPVLALAGELESANPMPACIAVTAGGFAGLIAMEFCEQLAGLGAVEGLGDALGGNAIFGVAVVASIGFIATILGLRCANALVATAAATIGVALHWFLKYRRFAADHSSIVHCRPQSNRIRAAARLWRSFGLRAPPAPFR